MIAFNKKNYCTTFSSFPTVTAAALTSGLINYWPIVSGTAQDTVGSSHLTSSSPLYVANRFGHADSALNITSSNTWTAPSGTYFSGDFTYTFWFNPQTTNWNNVSKLRKD